MRIALADDAALIYSDNWRHGWAAGFRGLGCEVMTVDISSLRAFGANGGPYSTRGASRGKILAQQILNWGPDLVWCYHGRAASSGAFVEAFRQRGVKTALFLPDEPYEVGESARFSPRFDFVFTLDHCTVQAHLLSRPLARQADVFYLPPCADTSRFKPPPHDVERTSPALFLGNPTLVPRETWLRAVEKAIPGTRILSWPVKGRPVAKGSPHWISDAEHPALYSSCWIGLNIHRDPRITRECYKKRVLGRHPHLHVPGGIKLWNQAPTDDGTGFWNDANLPAAHVNPRFFEMAACGTLVVNDNHRAELARMFPSTPRADTAEQFLHLVQYHLEHREEAEEIAQECRSLISRRHTYLHRAAEVLIRTGCKALLPEDRLSSLGAPEEWLTPQDLPLPAGTSSSVPTGR
jgi:spore maturation protein CgeB